MQKVDKIIKPQKIDEKIETKKDPVKKPKEKKLLAKRPNNNKEADPK